MLRNGSLRCLSHGPGWRCVSVPTVLVKASLSPPPSASLNPIVEAERRARLNKLRKEMWWSCQQPSDVVNIHLAAWAELKDARLSKNARDACLEILDHTMYRMMGNMDCGQAEPW
jgi:hypothetical protein